MYALTCTLLLTYPTQTTLLFSGSRLDRQWFLRFICAHGYSGGFGNNDRIYTRTWPTPHPSATSSPCIFLTYWFIARYIKVFKILFRLQLGLARSNVGNYRSVSLTCVICKLLESIIRDHIMEYLLQNKLLSNRQYGFIKGRSTLLQLLNINYCVRGGHKPARWPWPTSRITEIRRAGKEINTTRFHWYSKATF